MNTSFYRPYEGLKLTMIEIKSKLKISFYRPYEGLKHGNINV